MIDSGFYIELDGVVPYRYHIDTTGTVFHGRPRIISDTFTQDRLSRRSDPKGRARYRDNVVSVTINPKLTSQDTPDTPPLEWLHQTLAHLVDYTEAYDWQYQCVPHRLTCIAAGVIRLEPEASDCPSLLMIGEQLSERLHRTPIKCYLTANAIELHYNPDRSTPDDWLAELSRHLCEIDPTAYSPLHGPG